MNEMTAILDESVNRLLAEHCTKAVLQASESGTWPAQLWTELEEHGLTQALVPEDQGGVGASWIDALVIAFAAGRWRAPVPLTETIAAGWMLSQAGLTVPEGPLTLIDGQHTLHFDGDKVQGQARAVPWGEHCPHALAMCQSNDKWQLLLLSSHQANIQPDLNIAREPRDLLNFNHANVIASAAWPWPAQVSPVRSLGALMRSAQMAGSMLGIIETSVTYVGDREQFGRPIAKFQAIQHMLAIAAAKAAEARTSAEVAFQAMHRNADISQGAQLDIAAAKVVCGEAVESITDIAHQAHGAIGFTYEHELHFSTRRLWSWRGEFGAETFWAEHLGRHVLSRGADELWPDLSARQSS